MRNLLTGLILGLTLAAAGAWAFDPNWARQEQERQLNQQERFNQEFYRLQQQQRQLDQRPPC
jgi:hypothetical protein